MEIHPSGSILHGAQHMTNSLNWFRITFLFNAQRQAHDGPPDPNSLPTVHARAFSSQGLLRFCIGEQHSLYGCWVQAW